MIHSMNILLHRQKSTKKFRFCVLRSSKWSQQIALLLIAIDYSQEVGISWLPAVRTWTVAAPILDVFPPDGPASNNRPLPTTKGVHPRAIQWVNLRCCSFPIRGHEALHYRGTLRSSIRMTFIDWGIFQPRAKNWLTVGILSKLAVTPVLHLLVPGQFFFPEGISLRLSIATFVGYH